MWADVPAVKARIIEFFAAHVARRTGDTQAGGLVRVNRRRFVVFACLLLVWGGSLAGCNPTAESGVNTPSPQEAARERGQEEAEGSRRESERSERERDSRGQEP
jgi:hypothetical protein